MERLVFFVSLCLTVMADEGNVDFWKTQVTLTCPGIIKSLDTESRPEVTSDLGTNVFAMNYTKGLYKCTYEDEENRIDEYFFYIKGEVCENCYELDGILLSGIIIGDLLVTGGIVMIVYLWAQKKSAATRVSAGRSAPPRPVPRGPAVPNRDYEPLNPRTRENATYAVAGVNKTG